MSQQPIRPPQPRPRPPPPAPPKPKPVEEKVQAKKVPSLTFGGDEKLAEEDEELKAEIEKKKKQTRWVTRSIADEFTREDVLCTTFKEAILYVFFVVAVTICTVGKRSTSMFYITQALKQQFLLKEFQTANDVDMTFSKITTASNFWEYSTTLLLDGLYWEHFHNPFDPSDKLKDDEGMVLYENKMLGVPRIRQVKVKKNSCTIPKEFKKDFKQCYNEYSPENEDRSPFGLRKGTAWTYSSPKKTGSISYEGKVALYDGGGYYQDFSKNKNKTRKMLKKLRDNLWITRGTRAVFIDFSLYNANLNLFCICKLIFEFPPTGGVISTHTFHAVHLLYYVDNWDYVTFACECVVYAIAGYYLMEELREIVYFKHRYLIQFWSYMDLTNIAMAIANLVTSLIIFPNTESEIEKIEKYPKRYGNLEYLGTMKMKHNNFAACLLFFSYIKLFKYLNFNKIMGQLNNTLKRCALDVIGFSIMFFIIFFAYAQLGHVVFGTSVEDFRSFGVAMFTLLRTILGDFNFDAIQRANKVLAPVYFLTYIFFVFFVLLNMFLAIINDTYADVKTEIAISPDEMQMMEFLKRGFYNMLNKCGCKVKYTETKVEMNPTEKNIREALRRCGFSDLEVEMFFARYNIDPLAEVGDYNLQEIMKELESRQSTLAREQVDEGEKYVQLNEFKQQQDRFDRIEENIKMIVAQTEVLMRKLDDLQRLRKGAN